MLALCACSSQQSGDGGSDSGGSATDGGQDGGEEFNEPTIVLDRSDVQKFRGTEMVKLLATLDSQEPDDWRLVRRHVYPAPTSPWKTDAEGNVVGKNFQWPPKDAEDLSDEQLKWRSYLLWPDHIRQILQQDDWDSADSSITGVCTPCFTSSSCVRRPVHRPARLSTGAASPNPCLPTAGTAKSCWWRT